MEELLRQAEAWNDTLHRIVWGPWTLVLILAVGLLYSIKGKFFQVRGFRRWWGATAGACLKDEGVRKSTDHKSISQFQSLCTSLAATVGTGNIAGVATALVAGGPGALFWMWVSSLIGMMTIYAENVLGIRYRYRGKDGRWMGGPMIYLERGVGSRLLACLFAGFCVLSSFGMGNMAQANSIAVTLEYTWNVPALATGIVVAVLTGVVILGGIRRIARVAERVIPAAAGLYVLFCLVMVVMNIKQVPGVFAWIFKDAFRPAGAVGGAMGFGVSRAVRFGVARGVFSNEAGLGSTVMIHSAADVKEPETQGMWGMLEVFIDTIVMCTLTGVVILCSGVYGNGNGAVGALDGAALTAEAFASSLGGLGSGFVSVSMLVFAFATLIGWSYLGSQAVEYLLGAEAVRGYRLLFLLFIVIGCVTNLTLVWELSDIFNGLMAVPNLIALVVLEREVTYPGGKAKT